MIKQAFRKYIEHREMTTEELLSLHSHFGTVVSLLDQLEPEFNLANKVAFRNLKDIEKKIVERGLWK